MNERRQHIFVILALFMVIKYVIIILLAFQQIIMCENNVEMMLMIIFILEGCQMNTFRSLWKYEKVGGYVEHSHLDSFLENMFKTCM